MRMGWESKTAAFKLRVRSLVQFRRLLEINWKCKTCNDFFFCFVFFLHLPTPPPTHAAPPAPRNGVCLNFVFYQNQKLPSKSCKHYQDCKTINTELKFQRWNAMIVSIFLLKLYPHDFLKQPWEHRRYHQSFAKSKRRKWHCHFTCSHIIL